MTHAILAGRISRNPDGTIDPDVADAEWALNTNSTQSKAARKQRSTSDDLRAGVTRSATMAEIKRQQAEQLDPAKLGKLSMNDARAFKENCDAELKFIEVQKQKAKLLDREVVAGEISKLYRVHRDALLNIPSRLAGQVAALTEIADIQDVIAEEIRAVLEELSASLARIAEGNPQ